MINGKRLQKGLAILFSLILVFGLAACMSKESKDTPPASSNSNANSGNQRNNGGTDLTGGGGTMNADEPAWKLDTSPVELTWFVGASWYGHT